MFRHPEQGSAIVKNPSGNLDKTKDLSLGIFLGLGSSEPAEQDQDQHDNENEAEPAATVIAGPIERAAADSTKAAQ